MKGILHFVIESSFNIISYYFYSKNHMYMFKSILYHCQFYFIRKEPVRTSRVQPNSDYISQAAPPPPNITSSRHRYEQHSSDSRRSRQSPPPPPPPASRPKDSTVSMR